jgi:hypothetical protein
MTYLDPHRPVRLRNATCPYRSADLATVPSDRDHVVGRRFVPKGKLDQSWNLIVRSCIPCNRIKSQLEDDISALTMQPDAFGALPFNDVQLKADSLRKARKSISRRTCKPVAKSWETKTIEYQLVPGVTATFSLVVPPQLDFQRVTSLAGLHLAAFFYWITYDPITRRGGFLSGGGVIANIALRAD